mgnify:CR=1 FL=1
MTIIDERKGEFIKAIDFLKTDITSLRTGRATPALVEDINVESYGTKQSLKSVASITVSDAKTLAVDPWDKSLMQVIENAIRNSDIGISPVNDGKVIRLPLPDLTADRRQELIKVLHKKLENTRITIRKIREDIRGEIDRAAKEKDINGDERYGFQDELDTLTKEYNEQIKKIGEEKEKEITTI